MLEKRTKSAAAEIAEADGDFDTIDDLARENSLLVYLTDKSGNIIYATDSTRATISTARIITAIRTAAVKIRIARVRG